MAITKKVDITEILDGLQDTGLKTYLFVPSEGRDMKQEYPELEEVQEFKLLSDSEMRLIWLLGNQTSPLHKSKGMERRKAYEKAVKWSGQDERLSEQTKNEYLSGKFPSNILSAVKRMDAFIPSIRMKARLMEEKMFNNLSRMVDVAEEDLAIMPFEDKVKYANLSEKITNTMDILVVSLENSYGVKDVKKKGAAPKGSQPTIMDKAMQQSK